LPVLLLALAAAPMVAPAASNDWVPGATYDPRVPTIRQVLGFEPGTRLTTFYETEKLMRAWADAVPDRARLLTFGEDYEGKTLYHLVISGPENIQNLEQIRERWGKLADPRRLNGQAELDAIVRTTPASFLISTIDTTEASSVEAMQVIAYHLLAGTDPQTARLLQDLVVHVVPVENPAARERYVAWYNAEMSAIPKSDPQASEHTMPWGVGNDTNHYHLDPNRDGVSMVLRETRAKARMMREWHPEVALDLHEMGVDSPFFFPPYPEPYNTNLPIETLKKWWDIYAADLRVEFDRQGWRYFSLDAFGSPFLGMHTLYTQYLGAIGVLFEQAGGSGGIVLERGNGSLLTLRERMQHHVTGSISMLRVTADNREARHRDYHEFFRSSLNGVPGVTAKRYVFPPGDDPHRIADFVDALLAHGIEVDRAVEPFALERAQDYFGSAPGRRQFPAGSYVVTLSQPLSRLANAVLEKEPHHSVPFFYDISVWALPYNHGIEGWWTDEGAPVRIERVTERPAVKGALHGGKARVAYAWAYRGNREASAALQLAGEGFRLHVYPQPFKQGDSSFDPAAVLVFVAENDAEVLHDRIARLVEERAIDVVALQSSYIEQGSDLGSRAPVPVVSKPAVAVVTRDGVDSTAYGSTWFLFDQQYGLPFTPITIERLKTADLRRYTTIILPDGGSRQGRGGGSGRSYTSYFGEEGAAKLGRWVNDGGTLIAVKGGVDWAIEAGLSKAQALGRTNQTPGAIVRLTTTRRTPLTAGFPDRFFGLSRNTRLFRAADPRQAILKYAEQPHIAGYLTEADGKALAGSDYLIAERVGNGQLILFAEEPNLRNQWPVLHRLLFNAILLGQLAN
jgi:hypothetical protein